MRMQGQTYGDTAGKMPNGIWPLAIRLIASALVVALSIALFHTLARADGVLGLGFDAQGGCQVTSDGRGKEPYLTGEQFQGTCFVENHSTSRQSFTLTMALYQPGSGARLLGSLAGTVAPNGQRLTVPTTGGVLPDDIPSGPASIIFTVTPSSPQRTPTLHHVIFVAQRGENLDAYPDGDRLGPPKVRGTILKSCSRLDSSEPVEVGDTFAIDCDIAGRHFPAETNAIRLTYHLLDSSATWRLVNAPSGQVDREAGEFSVSRYALPMHREASSGHALLYVEASWSRPIQYDGSTQTFYETEVLDWALVRIHIINPNEPGPSAPATPHTPSTDQDPSSSHVDFAADGCAVDPAEGGQGWYEPGARLRVVCAIHNPTTAARPVTVTLTAPFLKDGVPSSETVSLSRLIAPGPLSWAISWQVPDAAEPSLTSVTIELRDDSSGAAVSRSSANLQIYSQAALLAVLFELHQHCESAGECTPTGVGEWLRSLFVSDVQAAAVPAAAGLGACLQTPSCLTLPQRAWWLVAGLLSLGAELTITISSGILRDFDFPEFGGPSKDGIVDAVKKLLTWLSELEGFDNLAQCIGVRSGSCDPIGLAFDLIFWGVPVPGQVGSGLKNLINLFESGSGPALGPKGARDLVDRLIRKYPNNKIDPDWLNKFRKAAQAVEDAVEDAEAIEQSYRVPGLRQLLTSRGKFASDQALLDLGDRLARVRQDCNKYPVSIICDGHKGELRLLVRNSRGSTWQIVAAPEKLWITVPDSLRRTLEGAAAAARADVGFIKPDGVWRFVKLRFRGHVPKWPGLTLDYQRWLDFFRNVKLSNPFHGVVLSEAKQGKFVLPTKKEAEAGRLYSKIGLDYLVNTAKIAKEHRKSGEPWFECVQLALDNAVDVTQKRMGALRKAAQSKVPNMLFRIDNLTTGVSVGGC